MSAKKSAQLETSEILTTAEEFLDLKKQKLFLEKRLEELREILEPYLENQPEKKAELHGWQFSLIATEREYFKLKEAKEKIDGRTLAPYLYTSTATQIRTTFKGGRLES